MLIANAGFTLYVQGKFHLIALPFESLLLPHGKPSLLLQKQLRAQKWPSDITRTILHKRGLKRQRFKLESY